MDNGKRLGFPGWQVWLVLVGFPALYLLNSFTPWSVGLFGRQDRSYWLPFMTSVLVLHWASALAVFILVRKGGGALSDLGLRISPSRGALGLLLVILWSAGMVFARHTMPPASGSTAQYPSWLQLFYPHTLSERCFWVVLSLSAGFCEELVYRGYAITALRQRGFRLWPALALASTSFVFVHGFAGLFAFPIYFLSGLFFAWLFLWRKSLVPGMTVHALFDVNAVFAV